MQKFDEGSCLCKNGRMSGTPKRDNDHTTEKAVISFFAGSELKSFLLTIFRLF